MLPWNKMTIIVDFFGIYFNKLREIQCTECTDVLHNFCCHCRKLNQLFNVYHIQYFPSIRQLVIDFDFSCKKAVTIYSRLLRLPHWQRENCIAQLPWKYQQVKYLNPLKVVIMNKAQQSKMILIHMVKKSEIIFWDNSWVVPLCGLNKSFIVNPPW